MEIKMKFGDILKELLEQHGLSQKEFAHIIIVFRSLTHDQKEFYIEQCKIFLKQNSRTRQN
jgi:transcriptional regulator with XRE-family HTH domain